MWMSCAKYVAFSRVAKRLACVLAVFHSVMLLHAQSIADSISEKDASHFIYALAADSMKGRANGSFELLQAADIIGKSYEQYGLQPLPDRSGYFLPFKIEVASKRYLLFNVAGVLPGKSKPGEIIV